MPVYNGAAFVGEAIESILAQTMGDFELIISDNASTDRTREICESYAERDSRIIYIRQPANAGANANYNRLFAMGRAPLFKWSAHDDVLDPTYLERCVDALERDPTAVLSHSVTTLIDSSGRRLELRDGWYFDADGSKYAPPEPGLRARGLESAKPWRRYHGILLDTFWCFEIFAVMRRSALARTRLMEEFYGTDKVLLADLALQGRFVGIEAPLFQRRCHPGTSTNLDLNERARWSTTSKSRKPAAVSLAQAYLTLPFRRRLSPISSLRSFMVAVDKIARPERIRRLLVPGPDNYLGIGAR